MVTPQDLAKIDMFEGIPAEELEKIASFCEEIEVKAGDVIFCEGCEADRFYILLKGNITLSMKLTSRPENLVLGVINKFGQSFGWSVMVSAKHYTATAECKEDARLLTFNGDDFLAYMNQNPIPGFLISKRMVEIVSSRLRYYRVLLKTF